MSHLTGWGGDKVLHSTPGTVHTHCTHRRHNLFSLGDPSARRVPGYRVTQCTLETVHILYISPSELVPLVDPSARTSLTYLGGAAPTARLPYKAQAPHPRIGTGGTFKLRKEISQQISVT